MENVFDLLLARKAFEPDVHATPYDLCEYVVSNLNDTTDKTFLVLYNHEFVITLLNNFGISADRIFLYTTSAAKKDIFIKHNINVIDTLGSDMKFDIILGNPPYNGRSNLYHKFFNKSTNMLKESGELALIHPAVVYYNNKDNLNREPIRDMLDNVLKYTTSLEFIDSTLFNKVAIPSDLVITFLTKTESHSGNIEKVKYFGGGQYESVDLKNINMSKLPPEELRPIREKYESFVARNGSLDELVSHDENEFKAKLSLIRGHLGTNDWYTFISADDNYLGTKGRFGLRATTNEEVDNIYSYLRTNFARFALVLVRTNPHLDSGEMKYIPRVSFGRTYTDEELFDMIGLTEAERNTINQFLPEYY